MPKPFNASENHPRALCLLVIATESYHSPFMLFPIVYGLLHWYCHLCFFKHLSSLARMAFRYLSLCRITWIASAKIRVEELHRNRAAFLWKCSNVTPSATFGKWHRMRVMTWLQFFPPSCVFKAVQGDLLDASQNVLNQPLWMFTTCWMLSACVVMPHVMLNGHS